MTLFSRISLGSPEIDVCRGYRSRGESKVSCIYSSAVKPDLDLNSVDEWIFPPERDVSGKLVLEIYTNDIIAYSQAYLPSKPKQGEYRQRP